MILEYNILIKFHVYITLNPVSLVNALRSQEYFSTYCLSNFKSFNKTKSCHAIEYL